MIYDPNNNMFLFTSESVNEGHPDKICDAISDAILDACLAQDPHSKVACETATKKDLVMVFGEITTKAKFDFEQIIRSTIKDIGYDCPSKGLDYKTCKIIIEIEQQSPDITQSVFKDSNEHNIGAGDQGIMFGYATDETPELMPLSHIMATKLGIRLTKVRKSGELNWVLPDGKTQVTIEYKKLPCGSIEPVKVHTIVISTQHVESVSNEKIHRDLMEHVIRPVIPAKYLTPETVYHLNPSGRFVIGGPHGDAGLTGRKIIVDTYGGWGAHGGGALSGKDCSKVDRSAAYAARWIAKSLVYSKLAKRVLIQLSYAIGISHPISVYVDSYGTVCDGHTDTELTELILQNFDLRPGMIIESLELNRPIFHKTATHGHFGRNRFSWEKPVTLQWKPRN